MATGDRKDPFRGYNFKLEIEGLIRAHFKEASGLDEDGEAKQKIPGVHKAGDVTLRRGVLNDPNLWNWYTSVAQGKTDRKHGSIVLLDEIGEEKVRWNFVDAWITKWTGPAFDANTSAVAIESLEIAHEGLTRT